MKGKGPKPGDKEWNARVSELRKKVTKPMPRERVWDERGGKAAQDFKNRLKRVIIKMTMSTRDDNSKLSPIALDFDDRQLIDEILIMVWRGMDTRTLLYKKSNNKARPYEAERDEAFVHAYAAQMINNQMKTSRKSKKQLRADAGKLFGIKDENARKIIRRYSSLIKEITGN